MEGESDFVDKFNHASVANSYDSGGSGSLHATVKKKTSHFKTQNLRQKIQCSDEES